MQRLNRTGPVAILTVIACSTTEVTSPPNPQLDCVVPQQLGDIIAFTGVSVIPMESEVVLNNHTVLVEDGVVTAVGATNSVTVPANASVIDQCAGFLMPGLADMHVHTQSGDLLAYVQSGITTVRNLWGYPGLQTLAADVANGSTIGPTIYSVSPGLDGDPPKWPFTQRVLNPALADSAVRVQVAAGWNTLKMYQDLSLDVYDAIVAAANVHGLDFVGHVPHRVGLEHVLQSGQRSIEHLSGYELALNGGTQRGAFGWRNIDASLIPDLVTMTTTAGAWNCPTLAIFSKLANGDEAVVDNRRKMVKALFDAGARLLIGTDSGIDVTQPGVSLHEEIAEFVAAGLTPYEAFRIATVEAAEFLGANFGTVTTGTRADLIMLAGNPLEDISLASQPALVMANGRIILQ